MSKTRGMFVRGPESRSLDMIIATVPLIVWSVIIYGKRALLVEGVCVFTAFALSMILTLLRRRIARSDRSLFDLSPVITGLLLSFTLPVGIPLYLAALGSAIAILIKEAFGGNGKNLLNPALTGRLVLEILFRSDLKIETVFVPEMERSALASVLENELPDVELFDMFKGLLDGGLGEISAMLIIAGGVYLILKRAVRIETPVSFLLAAALTAMLVSPGNLSYFRFMGAQLLTGGMMLSAFFFMSDPVTTPHVMSGRVIVGAIGGALAVLSRVYLGYEGVYIIVLVLGLWTPVVDRLLRPKPFGGIIARKKKTHAAQKTVEPASEGVTDGAPERINESETENRIGKAENTTDETAEKPESAGETPEATEEDV